MALSNTGPRRVKMMNHLVRTRSRNSRATSRGTDTHAARPLEVHQRFVPGVYPLYRRGWRDAWRAAMQRVAARGVVPFGRQALFLHCNLDHCATIAADAVAHVESGGSPAAWVDHAERYLDLRVRD